MCIRMRENDAHQRAHILQYLKAVSLRPYYTCDSSTIRLRGVRDAYDSRTIQHPTRSYAHSSNNEHVNSFAFAVRCCSQSARRRRRFCDDVNVMCNFSVYFILARVSGDLFQFILFSS